MRVWVRASLIFVMGLIAASGVYLVRSHSLRLEPGSSGWSRLVAGATPSGRVHARAVVLLPGLDRYRPNRILMRFETPEAERRTFRLAFDQAPAHQIRIDRNGEVALELPRAEMPGARIDISPGEGAAPLKIQALDLGRARAAPLLFIIGCGLLTCATTGLVMKARGLRMGLALGSVTAALVVLTSSPALLYLSVPDLDSLSRLFIPAVLLPVSLALVYSTDTDRRFFWKAAFFLIAVLLGVWIRWYFLPSAGSWDTEYWKAWMMRAVSHGVTRVYGEADAVPDGHFIAQLLGREKLWQIDYYSRTVTVDYPPLAMALWRWSWWWVSVIMPWLNYAEAQNVAVKLPSVVGDILAVFVLWIAFKDRPWRGLTLGALYWVLPVSWLSSAVLGFLDGAYVALALAALLAASRGKAWLAGAALVVASLIKPLALIVAPAVAIALLGSGGSLRKAVGAGASVIGLALVPFVIAGTLSEAVVHVFRILFQQRLSAGFANPWWIVGHVVHAVGEGTDALFHSVAYTRVTDVSFPAPAIALTLFTLALIWICRCQWPSRGSAPACLSGASLVLAYAILAMGVHENHPHLIFLALAGTGLNSFRLRVLAASLSASYVLNMLALSGLGRFYGPRHSILEPLTSGLAGLRMGLGFDLTLLLAVFNTAVFVLVLIRLRRHLVAIQS